MFAQSFQASDAIAPAEVSGGAASNGSTVTVNVSCAAFPCTITLTAPETVVVHAASVPSKKGKTKTLKLGSGKFTLKSKGNKKLTLKLSSAAKKLLKFRNAHFKVTAAIAETIQHKTTLTTKTLTVTVKLPKSHRR